MVIFSLVFSFYAHASYALDIETKTNKHTKQLVDISIDNVVIDTQELVTASSVLSRAISELSTSITKLSGKNINLNDEERAALVNTAKNITIASKALSELAKELPNTTEKLSKELPAILRETQKPISDISQSIQLLGDTVTIIADQLPTALRNTQTIVNKVTNSVLIKMYVFIGIFIALLTLAVGLLIFYLHKKLVSPVTSQLDNFASVPKQLSEMTAYMKETSDNLLILQNNIYQYEIEISKQNNQTKL